MKPPRRLGAILTAIDIDAISFCVLAEHCGWIWHTWPSDYRHPDSSEDLGTVEADTQAWLAAYRILSYRLLWFETHRRGSIRHYNSHSGGWFGCRRTPKDANQDD